MSIIISPLPHKNIDGICERRCKITQANDHGVQTESELWFQFDKSVEPPQDDDCDAYLLALIMDAMKEDRCIKVEGSVSKELLSNLVEYQTAWNKWLPDIYRQIDIICNDVREESNKKTGVTCAFSGGVDATFSVWRHSQSRYSYRSKDIDFCSIVHGFDIPLSDKLAFQNAYSKAKQTLADIGVNLYPIKTNYRKISKVRWEHSFTCALVATLSNFKSIAGTCLVGSAAPYDALIIPSGATPITAHLLSSDDFLVIYDGASHSRTEKVKEIADWKIGVANLRVCWQGDKKDRNCGFCEKCVRTKLNFLAATSQVPSCFPDSNIVDDMKKIRLKSDSVRAEWQQIYEYAVKHNLNGNWVRRIPGILVKSSMAERIFPKGSKQREIIKRILRRKG